MNLAATCRIPAMVILQKTMHAITKQPYSPWNKLYNIAIWMNGKFWKQRPVLSCISG